MDNKTINEIAAQIAQNYETAEVPMYGQRLCLPDRASVIAILELLQKLLFPAYFGDTQLLRLPPAQRAESQTLMERLAAESEGAQAAAYGSDVVARACLLQLLAGLNRFALAAPARHEVEDKAGPVVAEVLHYINEHYPDELSLDLLSAKFFISKYHLSHEFHRLVGTSVYRYIIQKRLVIAKQMLANGVAPTDVYGHCGFGDYANFYRAFKAEYHISPKQFLGRAGNENTFGG